MSEIDGWEENTRKLDKFASGVLFVVLGIAGVYIVWFIIIQGRPLSADPANWGQFGDYIGGLANPLIALFALLFLARGVQLQNRTLEVTRQELQDTRELLKQQQFDSRFFSAIDLLATHHREPRTGQAFAQARENVRSVFTMNGLESEEHIKAQIAQAVYHHQREISPFVHLLQNIIELLHRQQLSDNEAQSYIWPVRAFITPNESMVLAAFVMLDQAGKGFPELCEKYHLLKGISREDRQTILQFQIKYEQHLPNAPKLDNDDRSL